MPYRLSAKRIAVLTQAAGNMFEDPKEISVIHGPKGGISYQVGDVNFSWQVRDALVHMGLLTSRNQVSERGLLVLQDWLADGGSDAI